MAYQYSDYPGQARRLADAGDSLLEAIADPGMDRGLVLVELETATTVKRPAAAAPASPEDTLSAILLELQSANTLIAAGMALNEHGGGADAKPLNEAVAQIRLTRSDVESHLSGVGRLGFAPQAEPSATLGDARKLFLESGDKTLDSIAGGTESVVGSAFEKLKKADPSKVLEAIDSLGQSFQFAAAAGRLIRKGVEMLKGALDSLSKLFGDEALTEIKDKVGELWQKFAADNHVVRILIGEPGARKRVSDFAQSPDLDISRFDGISRELALLEDKFQGIRKILDGLVTAVVLAAGLVGTLQFLGLWAVAPWVPLAGPIAYASIMGAALLAGLNYTGARPLFAWIRGVCSIVPDAQLARQVQ
jgi:hypothetical protein